MSSNVNSLLFHWKYIWFTMSSNVNSLLFHWKYIWFTMSSNVNTPSTTTAYTFDLFTDTEKKNLKQRWMQAFWHKIHNSHPSAFIFQRMATIQTYGTFQNLPTVELNNTWTYTFSNCNSHLAWPVEQHHFDLKATFLSQDIQVSVVVKVATAHTHLLYVQPSGQKNNSHYTQTHTHTHTPLCPAFWSEKQFTLKRAHRHTPLCPAIWSEKHYYRTHTHTHTSMSSYLVI